METDIQNKNFALSLDLKKRLKWTIISALTAQSTVFRKKGGILW